MEDGSKITGKSSYYYDIGVSTSLKKYSWVFHQMHSITPEAVRGALFVGRVQITIGPSPCPVFV
jgi:hypothetical protein